MALAYDKLAEILKQPTPNKIVKFLVNRAREKENDDLADYLCEDQDRMDDMVMFLKFTFSENIISIIEIFHSWACSSKYSNCFKYRQMHKKTIYEERDVGKYFDVWESCGDPRPPRISDIRTLKEIVQHYKL